MQPNSYPNLTGLFLMRRLKFLDGNLITQATVSSILFRVWNAATEEITYSVTLDKTVVVFDTPQTNNNWPRPTAGYNLGIVLPASARPTGGEASPVIYVAEALVFPTGGGQPVCPRWELPTYKLETFTVEDLS